MFFLLKLVTEDCGRLVPDKEIWDAIHNSKTVAWRPNNGTPIFVAAEKGEPDLDAIDAIVRSGWSVYDIWEQSPVRLEGSNAELIIDTVFPGNPLLCVAKSASVFATRRRETWRKRYMSTLPLIVPNPMIAVEGLTQHGTLSEHTKAATAKRVYQVVEFDFSEKSRDGSKDTVFAPVVRGWKADGIEITDACAALILYLKLFLPTLVVVCFSGGKSIHAWFRVFELSADEQTLFMDFAVNCGADPATRCKSQFVRIPDGLRDNGEPQAAYYLDPQEAVHA